MRRDMRRQRRIESERMERSGNVKEMRGEMRREMRRNTRRDPRREMKREMTRE